MIFLDDTRHIQNLCLKVQFQASHLFFHFYSKYMRNTIILGEQEVFLKWRSSGRFLICCSYGTKAEILEPSRVSAD